MTEMNYDKIDIVIPWVDGNDMEWQKEKAKYKGTEFSDSSVSRYRDWDNLQYLFRGIEKFTPWVNKVYFITCGHLPAWLNTEHPKLVCVNHRDYIPAEFLPVFSCRPIELNIHRIAGLSDQFIYMNDDIFFLKPLSKDYFFKKGMPCDTAALTAIQTTDETIDIPIWNMVRIINRHFTKKTAIYDHFFKWFNFKYKKQVVRTLCLMPWKFIPGIYRAHGPCSYLKQTFETVWEQEPEALYRTCTHKFRETTDVTHFLCKMWQICQGDFVPRYDKCMSVNLNIPKQQLKDLVLSGKYPLICLNDRNEIADFEDTRDYLKELLKQVLPEKSAFEK